MTDRDADLKVGSTGNDGISDDGRLDRALRAMLAREYRPADLRARVIAAIDAPVTPPVRSPWRVARAPAFGVAAVLLVVALAMWWGHRDVPRDGVARDGRTTTAQARDVGEQAASPRPTDPRATPPASTTRPESPHASRRASVSVSRAVDQRVEWDAALPRLEPPKPLAVEPLDDVPVQVAALHIERLRIDPLEQDSLDRSREE
jgi:hypothetical protein